MEENWISIEERYRPNASGKYQVKLADNSITDAFYFEDRITWSAFYGEKPYAFWDCLTHQQLHNVIAWNEKEL